MFFKPKAIIRRLLTVLRTWRASGFLEHGADLHVGKGTIFWAPTRITIGTGVYLGKYNNIEANSIIGDYCIFANRVAIVGRHDHDYRRVGVPVRYGAWVGSRKLSSEYLDEKAIIGPDVWLGYGVVVLTGVTIGRGTVVAAGSVVTKDLPQYCIAAGVPARVIGNRFPDPTVIPEHEYSLSNGKFQLSENGYDDCVIEPKLFSDLSK